MPIFWNTVAEWQFLNIILTGLSFLCIDFAPYSIIHIYCALINLGITMIWSYSLWKDEIHVADSKWLGNMMDIL